MKIFNLPRGYGKTTRMLYASEYNNAPILCSTDSRKRYVMDMAKSMQLNIPEPISVSDIVCNRIRDKRINNGNVLVDEMDDVLREILRFSIGYDMIGGTITIDKGVK
jgi:hypothetical protein